MQTQRRARVYATIIATLFHQQGITGELKPATRGARHLTMPIRLDDSLLLDKALKLSESVALQSNVSYVQSYRQEGYVIFQFDLNQGYWQTYTRQDVKGLAVGLSDSKRPVEFSFVLPHCLVAGTTRSGKSVTIASILFGLMISYSPQELGMVIIDPDKELTGFTNAAHLEMPLVHEAADISKALLWSDAQLNYRRTNDIKDGKILVIAADEVQQEKLLGVSQNKAIIQNLAQGAKYGIHLILGTQKPTHTDMPRILDNLSNRFVGLVTDAGIGSRLTGQPGLNCNKLTGKGDFIHVAGSTVERLQVAMVTPRDYDTLDRREVQPINLEDDRDIVELPLEDVDRPAGRPPLSIDPRIAAQYFWRNPDKISIKMAGELFGLSRSGHDLHKKFATEFVAELIRQIQPGGGRKMRERPILMSGPMIRAILNGSKTQTRRVVKFGKHERWPEDLRSAHQDGQGNWIFWDADTPDLAEFTKKAYPNGGGYPCPYGIPGDSLWVRETWQCFYANRTNELLEPTPRPTVCTIGYKATEADRAKRYGNEYVGPWRPSIYMPNWASRLTLEVTGVRVERVQDISCEDAFTEGVRSNFLHQPPDWIDRDSFAELWDSINGKRPGCSWQDNPFVWVIEFSTELIRQIQPKGA